MLRDDFDTTGYLVRRVLTPGFGTGAPSPRPQLVQADVDQNGTPDFAYTYPVTFNSCTRFASYYNDTYSPINNQMQFFTPYYNTANNVSTSMTLADFNVDGYLDQALADSANNTVHIIHRFQTELTYLINSGQGPVHTAAQDIDSDQIPDLAIAYAGSNEVILLRTTTTTQFNRAYSYALPASPRRVLLADLNRDFYPDMLVVTADNQLRVYQHNGTNSSLCYTTIAPQILATDVNPAMLQVAYLDNDNYLDVIVGCPSSNTVRTYLNRSGTVTATQPSKLLTGVEVYPIPATDRVTVHQINGRAPLTATIMDELGRPVQQQVLTQPTTTLATGDLPRGLYLLRLVGDEGAQTTRLVLH